MTATKPSTLKRVPASILGMSAVDMFSWTREVDPKAKRDPAKLKSSKDCQAKLVKYQEEQIVNRRCLKGVINESDFMQQLRGELLGDVLCMVD